MFLPKINMLILLPLFVFSCNAMEKPTAEAMKTITTKYTEKNYEVSCINGRYIFFAEDARFLNPSDRNILEESCRVRINEIDDVNAQLNAFNQFKVQKFLVFGKNTMQTQCGLDKILFAGFITWITLFGSYYIYRNHIQ